MQATWAASYNPARDHAQALFESSASCLPTYSPNKDKRFQNPSRKCQILTYARSGSTAQAFARDAGIDPAHAAQPARAYELRVPSGRTQARPSLMAMKQQRAYRSAWERNPIPSYGLPGDGSPVRIRQAPQPQHAHSQRTLISQARPSSAQAWLPSGGNSVASGCSERIGLDSFKARPERPTSVWANRSWARESHQSVMTASGRPHRKPSEARVNKHYYPSPATVGLTNGALRVTPYTIGTKSTRYIFGSSAGR